MSNVARKPRGYWKVKENCLEEARKYSSKTELQKACGGAHASIQKNGWMDEACEHMPEKEKITDIILKKFLKENFEFLNKSEKSRQGFLLSKLIKEDGADFWKNDIKAPKFKLNSLYWFNTYNGKKYLESERKRIKTNKEMANILKDKAVKDVILDEEPEQYEVNKKPQSIIDFLR